MINNLNGERVGIVFGFDRKGNAKVRGLDSARRVALDGKKREERLKAERSFRDVVLLESAGDDYTCGQTVIYSVTSEGRNVNFFNKHRLASVETFRETDNEDRGIIDFLVLSRTLEEVRYLAVGCWKPRWIDEVLAKSSGD